MDIDKDKLEEIIKRYDSKHFATLINDQVISHKDNLIQELKALINPKWEPKEYIPNWGSQSDGNITDSDRIDKEERLYGNNWPTRELAETARDMNKRNQLILQYKTEKGFGDGRCGINHGNGEWYAYENSYIDNPELTFETKEQTEETIKAVGLNES
jgi:hypothetical protein